MSNNCNSVCFICMKQNNIIASINQLTNDKAMHCPKTVKG